MIPVYSVHHLNILRIHTIIPNPLINQRIPRTRTIIRHLDIIINHKILPPILAPAPLKFPRRNTTQIGRQARKMLNPILRIKALPARRIILIRRRALIRHIIKNQYILRNTLPRSLAHFPHLMIMLHEALILRHGAALGDEPAHVIDFAFAVVFVPEGGRFGVFGAVVARHDFRAVVLARGARVHFDAFGGGGEEGEAFHEGAADDGGPAVGGLHYFDGGVDGGADGFAEVGILFFKEGMSALAVTEARVLLRCRDMRTCLYPRFCYLFFFLIRVVGLGLGLWGKGALTCPNPPTMRTALTFLFVAAICPRTRLTTSWTTGSKIFDTSAPVIRNLPRRTPWAGSSARPGTVIVY